MRTLATRLTEPASGARRSTGGTRAMMPPRYGLDAADGARHAANDALEHEADRAADAVMRGAPAGSIAAAARGVPQRAENGGASGCDGCAAPAISIPTGAGAALAAPTRRYFEKRFGTDFGSVRVHTGGDAAASAASLGARAYASGNDIVFGAGEFRPDSREGRRLLVHELAHTVQQGHGAAPTIQPKLKVGAGRKLDTLGWSVTKAGDVYSAPKALRGKTVSVWNETFSSLLASPRTFEIAGTTDSEVDQNLAAHMKARLGVVRFAANKKYKFGAGSGFKMNPDFWNVGPGGINPKPGVDRQKAIEDINNPKNVGDPAHEYAIACQAATMLTMEGGAKSGDFQSIDSLDPSDWVPGDRGYIENIGFRPGDTVGLEGENLIYTGQNKFWGHFNPGLEYKVLEDWMDEVNSFNDHADARLLSVRQWTKVGLS